MASVAALLVRPATPADAPAIAAIYNEGIADRIATFETRERDTGDVRAWLDDDRRPFLVAARAGAVVGFARVAPYSSREAYAGVGEHGVYVARAARGQGVGRRLLDELCAAAEAAGLHKLTGRIFADNATSLAAHEASGFRVVGVQRRHARLDGAWKDCVLVERLLGAAAAPPGEEGSAAGPSR
jgi:phosphinothricin acetyltransferase